MMLLPHLTSVVAGALLLATSCTSSSPPVSAAAGDPDHPSAAELIDRAVRSIGGARTLDRIEGLALHGMTNTPLPNGTDMTLETESWLAFPDRARQEVTLSPDSKLVLLLTSKALYYSEAGRPGGYSISGGDQRSEFAASVARNPVALLKRRMKARYTYTGSTDIGGKPADVLSQEDDLGQTLMAIDPTTGRLLQISYSLTDANNKKNDFKIDFSDFRPVGNLMYPFRQVRHVNGQVKSSIVLDRVAAENHTDPSRFTPPPPFVE